MQLAKPDPIVYILTWARATMNVITGQAVLEAGTQCGHGNIEERDSRSKRDGRIATVGFRRLGLAANVERMKYNVSIGFY